MRTSECLTPRATRGPASPPEKIPRILFASPCGPYPKAPVERDPVDFFYYRNTLGQGIFRLRSFQSWYSLHFLAQNLPVPSVVLENPLMEQFQREVSGGNYQIVAIGFTVITTARVWEMVRWLQQEHPAIEIILGGYGTAVFKDPDAMADRLMSAVDRICHGEGVAFLRNYLEERWGIRRDQPLQQEFLPMKHCFFRSAIPVFKQLVFLGALGCTFGCPFCATSSQFDRRRIVIASGRRLFDMIFDQARKHPKVQSGIIYDEDFLMDRPRVLEFMHLMEQCTELQKRPFLLTVFASVSSLKNYSMEELVRCGIGTIYIGVESFQEEVLQSESLSKRRGDIEGLFEQLHRYGISTLGSLIIGWDGQSPAEIRRDVERFVALNPTFYQVVPLHPVPGTALWRRLKDQRRFLPGYSFEKDSIGNFTFALQSATHQEALNAVASTYRGLVAEGGTWPFRLFETYLEGYHSLCADPRSEMRSRAAAYGKMLRPLMPLAIISRVLFHGRGFRRRWNGAMRVVLRDDPGLCWGASVVALAVLPLLMGIYVLANLLYAIRPSGDQPEVIRRVYPACGEMSGVEPSTSFYDPSVVEFNEPCR